MANEKRLIDANALTDVIEHIDWYHIGVNGKLSPGANPEHNIPLFKADDIYEALEKAPTVEAIPVVHGRWINIKEYGNFCVGFCSVCAAEQKETSATALRAFHRHCRWCGARMDGDGNVV